MIVICFLLFFYPVYNKNEKKRESFILFILFLFKLLGRKLETTKL